jgi:hypothetical protein
VALTGKWEASGLINVVFGVNLKAVKVDGNDKGNINFKRMKCPYF